MKSQSTPTPLPSFLLLGKSVVLCKVGEVVVPIAKGLPPCKDLTWWLLQLGLMTLRRSNAVDGIPMPWIPQGGLGAPVGDFIRVGEGALTRKQNNVGKGRAGARDNQLWFQQ